MESQGRNALEHRGLEGRWLVLKALALALLAALYLALAFHPVWDVDVFWHIEAGRWIVENLRLPDRDLFSAVDPNREWHTFQWLYEVLVFAVDQAAGLAAVRVLHAWVAVLGLLLLAGILWKRISWLHGVAGFVLVAFIFADRLRVRPDVFNLFFFVLVFAAVTLPALSRRLIAGLCAVAFLWGGIHAGGALLLPVLLGARVAGAGVNHLFQAQPRAFGRLWSALRVEVLGLCLVALVLALTPGFVTGNLHSFGMLGPSEEFIPEWMNTYQYLAEEPLRGHERAAALLPLAGFLALLGWQFLRSLRDGWSLRAFHWVDLALACPMVMLSLEHVRFLWLGITPALLVLMRLRWPAGLWERWRGRLRAAGMAAAALLLAAAVAWDVYYHVWQNNRGALDYLGKMALDLEPGEFPEAAATLLAAAGVEGRILNHAPWGGYLLFRLWPACRVYTDGRGNFTREETHVLTTLQMSGMRRDAINAAWLRNEFEIVVHPDPFPVFDYSRWDWVLVYRDETARVYLRNARANQANFDRIRRVYGTLGLDLDLDLRSMQVYEFERRITRFWARQRLELEPWKTRLAGARAAAAAAVARREAGPVVELAGFYFDQGLYAEALSLLRQVLPLEAAADARGVFLAALAYLADGYPLEAYALCLALQVRAAVDPGVAGQLRGSTGQLFVLVLGHLEEYMNTVRYNRYRWGNDGGKWRGWE